MNRAQDPHRLVGAQHRAIVVEVIQEPAVFAVDRVPHPEREGAVQATRRDGSGSIRHVLPPPVRPPHGNGPKYTGIRPQRNRRCGDPGGDDG